MFKKNQKTSSHADLREIIQKKDFQKLLVDNLDVQAQLASTEKDVESLSLNYYSKFYSQIKSAEKLSSELICLKPLLRDFPSKIQNVSEFILKL